MKLDEIATRIRQHLERFEKDPVINAPHPKYKTTSYYFASAWRGGSRVMVRYVDYQDESSMTRAEAERYLAWLDAGNIGRHWQALRENPLAS